MCLCCDYPPPACNAWAIKNDIPDNIPNIFVLHVCYKAPPPPPNLMSGQLRMEIFLQFRIIFQIIFLDVFLVCVSCDYAPPHVMHGQWGRMGNVSIMSPQCNETPDDVIIMMMMMMINNDIKYQESVCLWYCCLPRQGCRDAKSLFSTQGASRYLSSPF